MQRLADAFQLTSENPLKVYKNKELYCININGQVWSGLTLDIVCDAIKQSLAIKYLDDKEFEKGK